MRCAQCPDRASTYASMTPYQAPVTLPSLTCDTRGLRRHTREFASLRCQIRHPQPSGKDVRRRGAEIREISATFDATVTTGALSRSRTIAGAYGRPLSSPATVSETSTRRHDRIRPPFCSSTSASSCAQRMVVKGWTGWLEFQLASPDVVVCTCECRQTLPNSPSRS